MSGTTTASGSREAELVIPAQHTPTPWAVGPYETNSAMVFGPGLEMACDCELFSDDAKNAANAAFIVRACNSHEALVKAAENFVAKVERGEARSVESYNEFKAALALSRIGGE